jgi:hypothetical protein
MTHTTTTHVYMKDTIPSPKIYPYPLIQTSTRSFQMHYPEQAVAVIIPEEVPPIYTERLLLRPLRIDNDEDVAGIFSIRSRQDVADWL